MYSPVPMSTLRAILEEHWAFEDFRGIQADIIESIVNGNDTLGLMPTGGGKSITFQVPALALPGLTIVISPLIALMKDQVMHLRRLGIQADAVHSGLNRGEQVRIFENAILGGEKILYISPERLSSPTFQAKVRRMNVSFVTVDEAHCISQWGYDFRPDYLKISTIRDVFPDIPILALTATATPDAVDDICRQLQFREGHSNIFRMSFERKNLFYVVREAKHKDLELLHILHNVSGPAIVYTRSREKTEELSKLLNANGIPALHYHAGLNEIDRDVRQRAWQDDEVRVMVATNAFGMGIDKPDVRLVVHVALPDSIEEYFQEAGRAGRDGKKSYAVLLYNESDGKTLNRRVTNSFPDKDRVAEIYDKLCYFFQLAVGDGYDVTYEFDAEKFCRTYHVDYASVSGALQLLTLDGYILYREPEENRSRLMFLVQRDELYALRNLHGEAEAVVWAVLRLYNGQFADYVNIDERDVAASAGLTPDEVYKMLILLTKQRILHYIPHKSVARITFLQRRVEHVRLSRAVYEERKKVYEQRLDAMWKYATQKTTCRSRALLSYFGEQTDHVCGGCDVCTSARERPIDTQETEKQILVLLADGRELALGELTEIKGTKEQISEAVRHLLDEGKIHRRYGKIYL